MKKLIVLIVLTLALIASVVNADQSMFFGFFHGNFASLGGPTPPTNYLIFTADRVTFSGDYLTF